jgi:hypothetical protein
MLNLDLTVNNSIMLSGGLDSAILLYLLLDEYQKNSINPRLQIFTIPKKDGSYLYVDAIVEYFNQEFKIHMPDKIFVGNPEAHHRQQSTTAVLEILSKYPDIDYIYFATNQNPDRMFDYSNLKPGEYPDRVQKSDHQKVKMPFIDMRKDQILKILFDNDQQVLIDLTHSCTEWTQGRCKICFQCRERQWAFDQLQKSDTGVN